MKKWKQEIEIGIEFGIEIMSQYPRFQDLKITGL